MKTSRVAFLLASTLTVLHSAAVPPPSGPSYVTRALFKDKVLLKTDVHNFAGNNDRDATVPSAIYRWLKALPRCDSPRMERFAFFTMITDSKITSEFIQPADYVVTKNQSYLTLPSSVSR